MDGSMERRKEFKLLYKETKPVAAVYQIKNNINGKMLVDSLADIRSLEGKKFQLSIGRHFNEPLQAEWNLYGENSFTVEVLETLKEKDDPDFDRKKELGKLKQKWIEALRPFGDKGYNDRL